MAIQLLNKKGFILLSLNKRLFFLQPIVNMHLNANSLIFKKNKFNNQYNIFITYIYIYKYMLHFGLISKRELQKK